MPYYRFNSTKNPDQSYTSEIIVGKDDDGERIVLQKGGEAVQINDPEKVKELRKKFNLTEQDGPDSEDTKNVKKAEVQQPASDTASAAPTFGSGPKPQQPKN